MAHFAELDENNIVLRVIRVDDAHEEDGENWCNTLLGGQWKQTSYNNNIRYNYAGVGHIYDPENDAFHVPQFFESWSLDENFRWQPPTPYPDDDKVYDWDEANVKWAVIPGATRPPPPVED
jgi:hypothetical protein